MKIAKLFGIGILTLLLAATAVFASEVGEIEEIGPEYSGGGNDGVPSVSTTITYERHEASMQRPQWVTYDPCKHGTKMWQRGNARNGYHGHWMDIPSGYRGGVLVWPNGALEMAKCGNEMPSPPPPTKVITITKKYPPVVKYRTERVVERVPVEVPGPMIVVAPVNAQPMWAVVGQPQPYSQTVVPGAPPMGGFVYAPTDNSLSASACAMGGHGGSVGPIDINNANTNVNPNNNVIQIGDGTASGYSNGTGHSTAGY